MKKYKDRLKKELKKRLSENADTKVSRGFIIDEVVDKVWREMIGG